MFKCDACVYMRSFDNQKLNELPKLHGIKESYMYHELHGIKESSKYHELDEAYAVSSSVTPVCM